MIGIILYWFSIIFSLYISYIFFFRTYASKKEPTGNKNRFDEIEYKWKDDQKINYPFGAVIICVLCDFVPFVNFIIIGIQAGYLFSYHDNFHNIQVKSFLFKKI